MSSLRCCGAIPNGSKRNSLTFTSSCRSPKPARIRASLTCPELESFARTDKERRSLEIYRSFSIAGATFITPPRTPPERVRRLRDAISAAYKDPEFFNDYKKITGEAPSPLTPDEFDEALKKLPQSAKMWVFSKKSQARARCRPARLSKYAWQIRLALKPVRFAKIRPARERSGDRDQVHNYGSSLRGSGIRREGQAQPDPDTLTPPVQLRDFPLRNFHRR